MARLIDVDVLIKHLDYICVSGGIWSKAWQSFIDAVKIFVESESAVDAVTVVRCSECKNLEMINNEGVFAKCNKHNMLFLLWEDDIREKFCSWGEVREDGKVD